MPQSVRKSSGFFLAFRDANQDPSFSLRRVCSDRGTFQNVEIAPSYRQTIAVFPLTSGPAKR